MNITNESLASDLEKTASMLSIKIHRRLKPGPEAANAFEYWQACFTAAREHTDAAYLQTKAETALTELMPCLT